MWELIKWGIRSVSMLWWFERERLSQAPVFEYLECWGRIWRRGLIGTGMSLGGGLEASKDLSLVSCDAHKVVAGFLQTRRSVRQSPKYARCELSIKT